MPYPGGAKTVGGPVGVEGKNARYGPRKVFLPLSAFFLQMSGEMEGDGGEIVGYRRKKKGKGKGREKEKDRQRKKAGGGNSSDSKGPKDNTVGGSGTGNDAIGSDGGSKSESALKIRWKKLPPPPGKPFETTGYEAQTPMGKATVTKRKKGRGFTWVLKVGKHKVALGRKADFDHAEGELLKLSKLDEQVQTSAHETTLGLGGAKLAGATVTGKRYAKLMSLINVGGAGSCPKCGSEPGTNIDCVTCVKASKTEMTTSGSAGGITKQGASHATTGGVMGTGNVPVGPIPLGKPLRRVKPHLGGKRKKRKKKREEWAERIVALAAPSK